MSGSGNKRLTRAAKLACPHSSSAVRATGRAIRHAHETTRTGPDHVHVRTAQGDGSCTGALVTSAGLIVVLVMARGHLTSCPQ